MAILVGTGGFVGSVLRYGLGVVSQRISIEWPIGTLAANVLGCFAIGLLSSLASRGDTLSPEVRLALITGFCGGFTTMSSMIYETAEMLRVSEYLHATIYAIGTFLLSMAAFIAGMVMLRIVIKVGGGLWS
jgi:CrcB protein